jgi:hypothetical protein
VTKLWFILNNLIVVKMIRITIYITSTLLLKRLKDSRRSLERHLVDGSSNHALFRQPHQNNYFQQLTEKEHLVSSALIHVSLINPVGRTTGVEAISAIVKNKEPSSVSSA